MDPLTKFTYTYKVEDTIAGPYFGNQIANLAENASIVASTIICCEETRNEQKLGDFLDSYYTSAEANKNAPNAKIIGFEMPFWNIVGMILKIAFASIPALILLSLCSSLLALFAASIGIVAQ